MNEFISNINQSLLAPTHRIIFFIITLFVFLLLVGDFFALIIIWEDIIMHNWIEVSLCVMCIMAFIMLRFGLENYRSRRENFSIFVCSFYNNCTVVFTADNWCCYDTTTIESHFVLKIIILKGKFNRLTVILPWPHFLNRLIWPSKMQRSPSKL